jgi:hypothetical protein
MTTSGMGKGFLLSLLCPSLLFAQSLGEAARKEQERRKKNKQTGVQAKVITEEDLRSGSGTSSSAGKTAEATAAEPAASTVNEAAPAEAEPDREAQERQWRERAATARANVERAEAVVKYLSQLSLVPGEYYVDEDGKTLIRDLAHLREIVAKAESDLAQAKQAQRDLEEEARRSGALPGWLR